MSLNQTDIKEIDNRFWKTIEYERMLFAINNKKNTTEMEDHGSKSKHHNRSRK